MDYGAFHATNSDLVNLSNERGTAHVPIFASGGVHSAKPIPTGGRFQVKVLERGNSTLVSIVYGKGNSIQKHAVESG